MLTNAHVPSRTLVLLGTVDLSIFVLSPVGLLWAELPVAAPPIGASHALSLMGMDKKVLAGRIRLVLLSGLGKGVVSGDYPAETLQQTLAAHFGGAA